MEDFNVQSTNTKLYFERENLTATTTTTLKSHLRRSSLGIYSPPEEPLSITSPRFATSKPSQYGPPQTNIINVRPSTNASRTPRSKSMNQKTIPFPQQPQSPRRCIKSKNEIDIDRAPDLKPMRTKAGFYIENEKKFPSLSLDPPPSDIFQSPAKKSISQSTVDGLGFDLETIDLTNDTDRRKQIRNDDIDEYENTQDSANSSNSSESEDDDEDENVESDEGASSNHSKSARRYISVESLILEDNFDASNGQKNSQDISKYDEEIPQVKIVWNTPPNGSPRNPSTSKGFTNLPLPRRSLDANHDNILNFFTRTEDGVEMDGRYDDVDMTISNFFSQTNEEDSEKVTKCINLKQVMDNIDDFVLQPAAIGYDIQCRVTRDRKGVDRGLYPTYYMHLERPDGRKILLLTGRKRKKSTTSNYLISTDASDLSRDSNHFVGKVRSNLLGTQFTIYDNGQSQKRFGLFQSYGNETPLREELAAVVYEPNVLGFKGPRKMKILIPQMRNEARRREHRPAKEKDSILELHKQGDDHGFFELKNKTPIWNDDNQSFVLNFHGRVTQASVKNFQIIHEKKDDYVILQFGRVASDLFTMDYRYPLCALQAFAIVLTSFDNKLACE